MEEDRKLYPFRFCSLKDEYSWGSEEFVLADLGYRDSLVRSGWLAGNSIGEIMDMYVDRVTGGNTFEFWGRQFPVCIRKICCRGKMPLRVHPDDETAGDRYDFLGKEKLWYVLRAGEDARIYAGFAHDTDASELYPACMDNSADRLLNACIPTAGQYFRLAPGTVHAASGDVDILEIAESSPLDFCLCGWGQEVSEDEFDPSLSMIDALDFINYKAYVPQVAAPSTLIDIPQFSVARMELSNPLKVSNNPDAETFAVYSCISGAASVRIDVLGQEADFPFAEGDTVLVPADCTDFVLLPTAPGTVILETTVPPHREQDRYLEGGS